MVIPYGTKILIGDKTYIAEDCGGAVKGKIIDIFFESHQEAKEFGRRKSNIFILEKEL
jgi:3D (Asp-Asp-Asp) domain-containing protein